MDPVTAVYYAIVCAVLSGTVPGSLRPWMRYAIGAAVGLIAATLLPSIRGALGLYG